MNQWTPGSDLPDKHIVQSRCISVKNCSVFGLSAPTMHWERSSSSGGRNTLPVRCVCELSLGAFSNAVLPALNALSKVQSLQSPWRNLFRGRKGVCPFPPKWTLWWDSSHLKFFQNRIGRSFGVEFKVKSPNCKPGTFVHDTCLKKMFLVHSEHIHVWQHTSLALEDRGWGFLNQRSCWRNCNCLGAKYILRTFSRKQMQHRKDKRDCTHGTHCTLTEFFIL